MNPATVFFRSPSCGCNSATTDVDRLYGVNTATDIACGCFACGCFARGIDSAAIDGDRPLDPNAAAIPPRPDSITGRGNNSATVNRDTILVAVIFVFGKNAAAVPLSFSARGVHAAAVNGDCVEGVNTITTPTRIPARDRQRGIFLAADGEAAIHMNAAAGGTAAVRGFHGVLAHQHKVHIAGREVNGNFLFFFNFSPIFLNGICIFPCLFDGGVLQG